MTTLALEARSHKLAYSEKEGSTAAHDDFKESEGTGLAG
jgi:hypothetical protein